MTLTLTASGISPCLDATDDMVITISPQVTADAGADATICVGGSYNLSGTSAPNSAGVSWTHNGNGTITEGNTLTPTYNSVSSDGPTVTLTLTASGISPCLDATDDLVLFVYKYSVLTFSSAGCSSQISLPITITIVDDPTVVSISNSPQDICEGGVIDPDFDLTVSGGLGNITYAWYDNNNPSSVLSTNPTFNPGYTF